MKIFVSTNNDDKFNEIKSILADLGVEIIKCPIKVNEDGKSLEENAIKKAKECYKKTEMLSIADDTGLEVDVLNGAPGVYSSRFAGNNATYKDNRIKLLNMLKGEKNRKAKFKCVIAVIDKNNIKTFWGEILGYIAEEEKGNYGFGYDSIFIIPTYNKTLAELPPEIKNKISHRAIALNKAKNYLREVAQLGSALGLGPRGHGFKSHPPD